MPRARFTRAARNDLRSILAYIARNNPPAAARLLQRLEGQAARLAEAPGIGRPREELRPGLRSFAVGSYTIFYRPAEDGVIILRVLHGARRHEALLAGSDDE